MKNRIISCLAILGTAGLVFAFGEQVFMGLSLLSTLAGLAVMAVAIRRSGALPKWSGWVAFAGFFLIPFPGVALQFFANALWGEAYFWMAYGVSKQYGKMENTSEKRPDVSFALPANAW
jgi:hypothetical protein